MLFLTAPSQTQYIHLLAKKIGLGEDEYNVATSTTELESKLPLTKPEQPIYLDVSLAWDNHGLAQHHGFSIAADLRRKYGARNPLFFCGFLEQSFYEKLALSDPRFHILFGSGSYYCQYPIDPHQLVAKMDAAKPLDAVMLHDVVTMLCNTKGIVNDKLNHRLIFEHGVSSVQVALQEVAQFLSEEQKGKIGYNQLAEKLIELINNNNREGFNAEKDLFLRACTQHLTQEASMEEVSEKVRYKVLLVDDRQVDLDKYTALLEKDFSITTTTTSEEAIRVLEEDHANSIVAVISDWRLYKSDNPEFWQEKQGYEVLRHSATTGMRALFALTSQADYVVHHIRNLMGIRFSMFKKENLETLDQWQLFRSILINSCTEISELIVSIPSKEKWIKPQRKGSPSYQEEYLQMRNAVDWPKREAQLSTICNDIWYNYYWKFLNRQEEETLQDFSERFGRKLDSLENTLVARRICVALFYKQSLFYQSFHGRQRPRANTFSLFRAKLYEEQVGLNRQEFGDEMIVDKKERSIEEGTAMLMDKAATQLLNVELCLDMTNLESGLLPEEKNWLRRNNITFSLEGNVDDEDLDEEVLEKDETEKEEKAREKYNQEPVKSKFKAQKKELKKDTQAFKENFSSIDAEEDEDQEEDLPE